MISRCKQNKFSFYTHNLEGKCGSISLAAIYTTIIFLCLV